MAKETNFIQRERKLNAIEFIRLLFSQPGIIAESSLTSLCAKLAEQKVYMTKEALNKRFNEHAVQFLEEIYQCLFEIQSQQLLKKLDLTTTIRFKSIRILDGTTITLPDIFQNVYPGAVGSGIKYQIEFDYLTGRFMYVEKQAGKAGDSPSGMKRLETVQQDDLVLQDLGYFKFDLLKEVEQKEAFYASRARTDTMFYVDHPNPRYHNNGEIMKKYAHERLLLEEVLKTMTRGEVREYSKVYLGKHARLPSRLVIYRMTKAEQRRQEERIRRRGQTKQGKIKQKSRDLSSISIYVTNLPLEVPAREVIELYRYRWQIELLFKSWKSDMKADCYREMKLERWECHLYVELIILVISVLITYQLRVYFWEEKRMILSEQIATREISKKIWVFWQARDGPNWLNTLNELIKLLANIGRKNVKKPESIGWLA